MAESLKDAALSCVARNWAVFPLVERDKIPAVKGGFQAGTVDADQIGQAWEHRQNMNVGVATGSMSRGLVVIDLDVDEAKGENGLDTLHEWEREYGELPDTVTAITGRGGM
ncbi:MAG: bifunctional DNA primase/polymerase, partial [Gordonibacter sp.]